MWPYAPEGWGTVLSTIPPISTTVLGLLGELLMSGRSKQMKARLISDRRGRRKLGILHIRSSQDSEFNGNSPFQFLTDR